MMRLTLAVILTAALSASAGAQPTPPPPAAPSVPVPLPAPPPPAIYHPDVYPPPDSPPGPAIPFIKSGGRAVGAYGLYPYDTGNWLLGGSQGLTRQSGAFTMVFPVAPAPSTLGLMPVSPGHTHSFFRHGRYCR